MKTSRSTVLALAILAVAVGDQGGAHAASTSFTYQGRLQQSGVPVDGACDLRFTLHADGNTGAPVAGPIDRCNVPIANGLFTVPLDFGQLVFNGQDRWLAVEVRCPAGPSCPPAGPFTPLAGRQQLTATPYALSTNTGPVVYHLTGPGPIFFKSPQEGVYVRVAGLDVPSGTYFVVANFWVSSHVNTRCADGNIRQKPACCGKCDVQFGSMDCQIRRTNGPTFDATVFTLTQPGVPGDFTSVTMSVPMDIPGTEDIELWCQTHALGWIWMDWLKMTAVPIAGVAPLQSSELLPGGP